MRAAFVSFLTGTLIVAAAAARGMVLVGAGAALVHIL